MTEEKEKPQTAVESLRSLDHECLLEVLRRESPQTAAMMLCCLPEEDAAFFLENMDGETRGRVAFEIAQGASVPADALELAAADIAEKVAQLKKKNYVQLGGVDFAGAVLRSIITMKVYEEIVGDMERSAAALFGEIKKRVFMFDDIARLDDRAVQKILRCIDMADIAKALKGAGKDVCNKIFGCMSRRARAQLKKLMRYPVRKRDVDECRWRFVNVAKQLEKEGEIVLFSQDNDALVQ